MEPRTFLSAGGGEVAGRNFFFKKIGSLLSQCHVGVSFTIDNDVHWDQCLLTTIDNDVHWDQCLPTTCDEQNCSSKSTHDELALTTAATMVATVGATTLAVTMVALTTAHVTTADVAAAATYDNSGWNKL